MIALKLFINILSSIMQIIIFDRIFSAYGDKQKDSNKIKIIAIAVYSVLNGILITFANIPILFIIIGIILMLAYSFIYIIKARNRFFIVFILTIIGIVVEMLVGMIVVSILRVSVDAAQSNVNVYLINSLFSKLILLGIILAEIRLTKKRNIKIEWQVMTLLSTLPIASFAVVLLLSKSVINNLAGMDIISVSIASILLLLSNLAIFILFSYIEKIKDKEKNIAVYSMQLEMEKVYYQDMVQNYIASNKSYHDLKNKLFAIDTLLKTDINQARKEIASTCDIVGSVHNLKYTYNDAVDSLLYAKIKGMIEIGVTMNVVAFLSSEFNYNPIDMCIVLGNIIDNAIHETQQLDSDKNIELEIKQIGDKLAITIINPISKNINVKKVDKFKHGYGLKSVKEVVDKYNGELRYGKIEGRFIVNIVL